VNFSEQLLSLLASYGLPILAVVLFAGSIGLPLPGALLLIASGAFVAGGQMSLWPVLIGASAAAIAGDLVGYSLGRWAGHAALRRVSPKLRERLDKTEQSARKWGAWGIFLTRWLITPLGPWVNLISGASEVPWPKFLFWDVFGEILWVVLYVLLGHVIAAEVQTIGTLASDITWILLMLAVAGILAWRLVRIRHRAVWETIVIDADRSA
jgi:membrane-associated protein